MSNMFIVQETNPAAVSAATSAPLDQEYSANMNAPRTAQSADMQKDDMGGEAMDTEMNNDEDNHYGKYTIARKIAIRTSLNFFQVWIQTIKKRTSKSL